MMATAAAAMVPWAVAAVARVPRRSPASGHALAIAGLLARVGRRVGVPAAPSDLGTRLHAAGLGDRVRVTDVMAIKIGAAVVGLSVAIGPATLLPGHLGRLFVLGGPIVGFVAPDVWLRRRAHRRARQLAAELADGLELLRVAVDAGFSPWRALEEVGRRHRGLLGAELRLAAARTALGVSREVVLAQFVARCPLDAVGTFAAALARAERHGAPLGPVLADLAVDVRAERARSAREHAARAAPKIQLAIALLLVPGVLMLVAAAFQATTAP